MSDDDEPPGLMGLLERVAVRLAHDGVTYPVAAAAALAARGHEGLEAAEFAAGHGIEPAYLAAAESGAVPLNELPEAVLLAVVDHPGLDLAEIEDLDRRMALLTGNPEPPAPPVTTPGDADT